MPVPAGNAYSVASGQTIYAGRSAFDQLGTVTIFSQDAGVPYTTPNQTLVVQLHESGGATFVGGRQYRAQVSGRLAYDTHTEAAFATARSTNTSITLLRPTDKYGTYPNATTRQLMWLGAKNMPDGVVRLMSYRRVLAETRWAIANLPNCNFSKNCIIGGSMGAWGSLLIGLRNPDLFAAIYSDRPRWRYDNTPGNVAVVNWTSFLESVAVGAAPNLHADDGGGSVAVFMDNIALVSNTSVRIPWVSFCCAKTDGFAPFSDFIAAVVALRAAGRAFACAWKLGGHGDSPINLSSGGNPNLFLSSYPYGLFEIGKGFPLFTEHSLDQDPSVDDSGGINLNLTFRNVVETSTTWSCEVTSIAGACTVKVKPYNSLVFLASAPAQLVTIPAANSWQTVSFSA